MTHICVSKLTIIGSDNGLWPGRRQAIIWTNAGILLIRTLWTNFSEILIEIISFSFKKMRLKVSSAKWRLFGIGLNELIDSGAYQVILTKHGRSWWLDDASRDGCRGKLFNCCSLPYGVRTLTSIYLPLQWRHNGLETVSNHQPHNCLLSRLLGSKKTSKHRVTGLCAGNSPRPVNSPHKGPVTRKMFPFDDVIMADVLAPNGASPPADTAMTYKPHRSFKFLWLSRVS